MASADRAKQSPQLLPANAESLRREIGALAACSPTGTGVRRCDTKPLRRRRGLAASTACAARSRANPPPPRHAAVDAGWVLARSAAARTQSTVRARHTRLLRADQAPPHFAIAARPPDPRCGRSGAAEATVRRGLILSNSPRAGPSHTPSSSAPSSDFARYPTPSVGRWPFGAVEPARQDSARPALPRPPEALPCSPRLPPAPRGTPHRSGACHCKRRSGEIQGVVMALWAGKPPTPTPVSYHAICAGLPRL